MRSVAIGLLTIALLAGCGPTPEQKAAAAAAAKKVEAVRLKAEADLAREREEAPLKAEAMKAISERLLDPSSVQFRNVTIHRVSMPETATLYSYSSSAVCGEYNGKNGYGGYVGFMPFGYLVSQTLNGKAEKLEGRVVMIYPASPKNAVTIYEEWC